MADQFVNSAGVGALKAYIDAKQPQVVTDGYWRYRINGDGTFEAWYMRSGMTFDVKYSSGNFYRSDPQTFALPTALSSATVLNAQAQVFHGSYPAFGALSTLNPIKVQALSGANRGASPNYTVAIYAFGTVS